MKQPVVMTLLYSLKAEKQNPNCIKRKFGIVSMTPEEMDYLIELLELIKKGVSNEN